MSNLIHGAAWAADPERIDPEDYPPGEPFVKQITWAPCARCGVEVHLPVTQFLLRGLCCPRCEELLLPPPPDAPARLQRALREEDVLSAEIER